MNFQRLWRIYTTVNEWIHAADTKASILLLAHGATATFLVPQIVSSSAYFRSDVIALVILILGAIFTCFSVFFGFKCVLPTLSIGEAQSQIFFKHIACQSSDEFGKAAKEVYEDDADFADQLLNQIWANSSVALYKHQTISKAIKFLFATVVIYGIGACYAFLS